MGDFICYWVIFYLSLDFNCIVYNLWFFVCYILLRIMVIKKILEFLIIDLKILEIEGIYVLKLDGDYIFFGKVSVVIANNLGV